MSASPNAGWSGGYTTDVDYVSGFYAGMAPSQLGFALALAGVRAPAPREGRPLRLLELGAGLGETANVIAAANPDICVEATDFMPRHAVAADDLAHGARTGLIVREEAFEETRERLRRERGEPYDIIGLHGVWTWVSQENRRIILDIVRERLRPGGALYVSYNAQPGWAAATGLRDFLKLHAAGDAGSDGARLSRARTFAEALNAADAGFFAANPLMARRLELMKTDTDHYLVHEYMTGDWRAFWFTEVAEAMAHAKLDFAGSALLSDHFDAAYFTDQQRALLSDADRDPGLGQATRDVLVNRLFRRDYFVRGAPRLADADRIARLTRTRLALVSIPSKIPEKTRFASIELVYPPRARSALIEGLCAGPRTLREIATTSELPVIELLQVAALLISLRHLAPCRAEAGEEERRARTDRFNAAALREVLSGGTVTTLASPVTGSGLSLAVLDLLFVAATKAGEPPAPFAATAARRLKLPIAGEAGPLEGESALAQIHRRADRFAREWRPVLQHLKILDTDTAGEAAASARPLAEPA